MVRNHQVNHHMWWLPLTRSCRTVRSTMSTPRTGNDSIARYEIRLQGHLCLLRKLADLGLPLLTVTQVGPDQPEAPTTETR